VDLSAYNLKDILLSALKSEIDSKALYRHLANRVKNDLLKDKLLYLAKEEEKHRTYIKKLYTKHYPNTPLTLPATTPVPLPTVPLTDEDTPLSTIIGYAMKAEQAAAAFYEAFSTKIPGQDAQHMIRYFADMERGHYALLKLEQEAMERFEEADVYWPMVHVGP